MSCCAVDTGDMVSNESNQRRNRNHLEEERSGEVLNTTSNLGCVSEEYRPDPVSTAMYPTPSILIVDYNGFQLDDDFFIKELALYQPFAKTYWVGTFKRPFNKCYCKKKILDSIDQQTLRHMLSWDEGEYPYFMLPHILKYFSSLQHLYAKNSEKACELYKFTDYPVNILYSPENLPFGSYCSFHDATKYYCALDNAVRMGQYFVQMHSFKTF